MFRLFRSNSGLTLVELLIAITIFATSALIASQSFILLVGSSSKAKIAQQMYDDTRYTVERLTKLMRESTIDYEEYHNVFVETPLGTPPVYGSNYGRYGQRFIDPGIDPDTGIADEFGSECVSQITGQSVSGDEVSPPCPPGQRIAGSSIDENVGRNPHNDDASFANALCQGGQICQNTSSRQEELYLINGFGDKKTILKRIGNGIDDDKDGQIDDGGVLDSGRELLVLLEMDGSDTVGALGGAGTDGIIDSWVNAPGFTDFVSITPPSLEITQLDFYIAPLEDPHKAFREEEDTVQLQPHITLVLSARPSRDRLTGISGVPPSITIQTTVTSRVLSGIPTF